MDMGLEERSSLTRQRQPGKASVQYDDDDGRPGPIHDPSRDGGKYYTAEKVPQIRNSIEKSSKDESIPLEPLGALDSAVLAEQARASEGVVGAASPRMKKVKWLACIALCTSYTTSLQQLVCTSAIVKHIDDELGPTSYYNWMLSANTIALAVAYPISGGMSDILGRKWFFVYGAVISLVGTVIALCATSTLMVIVGMALKGIGGGSQQLALAAIAELVPNRQRGIVQAVLDIVTTPWAVFGGLVGNAMVKYTRLSFRINFIIGVFLNIVSIVMIYFWYHPPSGGGRGVANLTKKQQLLQLDWVGVFLMAVGIVLTLLGLAFGGTTYNWGSAGNVVPLTIGLVSLIALPLWEWKGARNPFFAHELFIGKTRTFTLLLVITFISGMSLYTALAFWTQQCQGMYTDDPMTIGVASIPGGFGGSVGSFLAGFLVGRARWLRVPHILVYANTIKLVSDGIYTTFTPKTFARAVGMTFMAGISIGASLIVPVVGVQLASEDKHIGLATLVLGSIRSIGGSVAITIYTSIMQNGFAADAGPRMRQALAPFNVSSDALPSLIGLLSADDEAGAAKLPGVSPEALAVAVETIKWSWAEAFKRIYYAAATFSAIALLVSFFVKDSTENMTDSVAVRLMNDNSMPQKSQKQPQPPPQPEGENMDTSSVEKKP